MPEAARCWTSFGSAKFDINGIMSREDRAAERKLEGRLVALNSQLFRENQQKDSERSRISTLKADLVKARIDYDSFSDKLYASYPELKVDRAQVLPFSIQDANAALVSEDAVAVEFQVLDCPVNDQACFRNPLDT